MNFEVLASRLSGAPHSPQNFWPIGLGAAQAGQTFERRVPQLPQNLLPRGFSSWQRGQLATAAPTIMARILCRSLNQFVRH